MYSATMDIPHYWTADQVKRLLDALASHNRHQARTAALIMWRTGLRGLRGARTRMAGSRLLGRSGYSARPEVEEPTCSHRAAASGSGAAVYELAGQPVAAGQGGDAVDADHAGVEFRSLAEDFDTSTATGKLQLQMVLAFSEWWRNSIRDRSVAGQAKARAEGRFPGRRPSLTEQQREYIRIKRSKGVSQRELAKLLEVSRWTIQQVDG